MLYVKKLAAQAIYVSLTSHGGGAIIVRLGTSTGRALAVQVGPGFLSKLNKELDRLRQQLGISKEGEAKEAVWRDWSQHMHGTRCASCPLVVHHLLNTPCRKLVLNCHS